MRDRLIELISKVQYMGGLEEKLADHLLAAGVIVPPCKVGDTVYYISRYYTGYFKVHECIVDHITVYGITMFVSMVDAKDRNFNFGVNCSDTSLFFNKEAAKKALARIERRAKDGT